MGLRPSGGTLRRRGLAVKWSGHLTGYRDVPRLPRLFRTEELQAIGTKRRAKFMCKLPGRFLPGALASIQSLLMACSGSVGKPEVIQLTEAQPLTAGLVTARTVPVGASMTLAVAPGATLPDNNAAEVPVDTLLRIGFDEAPTIGPRGTVKIH